MSTLQNREVNVKAMPPPQFGPFVASGGMGVIGQLQLWNVAAGMNIPDTNVDVLLSYGSNMNTVTIDRTKDYPEIAGTSLTRDARVTTTIKSASILGVSVYYRLL